MREIKPFVKGEHVVAHADESRQPDENMIVVSVGRKYISCAHESRPYGAVTKFDNDAPYYFRSDWHTYRLYHSLEDIEAEKKEKELRKTFRFDAEKLDFFTIEEIELLYAIHNSDKDGSKVTFVDNDKDSYVSLDTVIKMEKLGFDWDCHYRYIEPVEHPEVVNNWGAYAHEKPSLSIGQKWLREKFGYHISVNPSLESDGRTMYYVLIYKDNENVRVSETHAKKFDTYEDALSEAIDRCVDLLIEEKNG